MKKLKVSNVLGRFLGRAVSPSHIWQAFKLQRARKANRHLYDGAELKLYSELLLGDFLHYGYFEEPEVRPEDMRLSDIVRAQNRYAELLMSHALDREWPVLDVGCGMGGLCRMLLEQGFKPVALTPDRMQAANVREKYPSVPVFQTKFERMTVGEHEGAYGTVFTSESLQYLKLDQALPLMDKILRPGGRWIACDYFHREASEDRSCHVWDEFTRKLEAAGWEIKHQQEITANVLPTLKYVHMWATRLGIPLMHFSFLKLRKKQPGLHHMLETVMSLVDEVVEENLVKIDPVDFLKNKKYVLAVMERSQ